MSIKKIFLIAVVALASIAGAFSVYSYQGNYKQPLLIFPKGSNYEKEWKKVDSLAKKGLNRSALDVVEGIYAEAKAENNSQQLVKAIIHRMRFEQGMEEYSLEKALSKLNEEAQSASYPVKPVLQSIIAESYWNYFQQNRWKFYERAATTGFQNDDISTWDLKMIVNQVIKNYQASLQSSDSLKRTPLNIYDDILVQIPKSRKFRPTLYDFLAHRAVDFYMSEEPEIDRPADKFEISSESYFWNAGEFSKLNIQSRDSFALKFYGINILQDLIAFHLKDEDPQALIDADLKRLHFVHSNSVSEIKDSLYLDALQSLEKQFYSNSASADVSYEIAKIFEKKGDTYKPLQSDENKWMKKRALELCDSTIKRYPSSDGALNCKALKAQILEHSIGFNAEKVVLPLQPSKGLLTCKNVKKVYVRIAQMDADKYNHTIEHLYGDKLIEHYLKQQIVEEYAVELPDDGDHQSHSAEIKIPALAYGHYVLLIGSDKGFSFKNNAVAYASITASSISFLNRRTKDGSYDFYVQNRFTGEPLVNAEAQLYYQKYNYSTRKYEYVKSEKYVSDTDGYFNVPSTNEYRNFSVEFTYQIKMATVKITDRLHVDNGIYQYRNNPQDKNKYPRTVFFLDRGIYRPGQTVYFKGIMLNTDGESNEILANHSTTVTFYDVNYQKISSLDLKTNEYGTFSGSFTTPTGVLNGNMTITNGSGNAYFSVEEYKRPKFELSFKPVEGSYRLNENIKVTGIAQAYSGAKIDAAEVKYRVVRSASFPYWWFWWRGYFPTSAETEIINGTTITNDTGAFFVDFKAIPDLSIPRSYEPTYSYVVYADVTDINGETHSIQTSVSAAYTALNLNIGIPEMLDKQSKQSIVISTTNMSGQFMPAKGRIEIFRLNAPEKTFRGRLWAQPDKYLMTKEEFTQLFPNDEYKDESNMYKWERAEKVMDRLFENATVAGAQKGSVNKYDSLYTKSFDTWRSGVYVMEAHTKDAYGQDVKEVRYFTLYSNTERTVATNSINWFKLITDRPLEPGNNAKFVIGTREKDVTVLYEIEHKGIIVKKEFLRLSNEQRLIELPVEEKHRGNFSIHLAFVKNNRTYSNSAVITVPYTNKDLDISFETFRDKLQPGQQEQWKVKIRNKKGDKVAAEMVATLYDASLDAFRPNSWYFNIYNHYYTNLYWESHHSFGSVASQLYAQEWNVYPRGYNRNYDRLNWFGYYSYASRYGYYEGNYDGDMDKAGEFAYRAPMAGAVSTMEEKAEDETTKESPSKDKWNSGKKKESATGSTVTKGDNLTATAESVPAVEAQLRQENGADLSKVATRSNFAETAFFYPQMETDKDGSLIIKFTIPEALTKWKMMGFAHTKDLQYGHIEKELQTQKDLMVIPGAPRFFRENDRIDFSTKISNLSDKELTGTAQLILLDAVTMKDVTSLIVKGGQTAQPFSTKKGQSTSVSWSLSIPEGLGAISYKVVAKAGNFSDGEEMAIPVLTNRMLVTESMPISVRSNQTKNLRFEKLISQSNGSSTLRNHKLSLEFTSNPAWYAIQALPYLMEYPYECSEQTFSRYYANSIASHISNSSPKIKAVFNSWKTSSPDALLSNLEKNQELKSLMLEETPWVLDAKDESERKKRVGLLFDLNKMSNELNKAMKKLQKAQSPNGGWPWFEGMPDDRYITQHIITGMGHLDHLGVKNIREENEVWNMVKLGTLYLDNRIREDYEWLLKHDKAHLDDNHLGSIQIQYLYARSYFKDIPVDPRNQKAFEYYKGQAKKYWLSTSRYMQGMIALGLHRYNEKAVPATIMKSLKETSITSEEMGMYWKDNYEGYYWYQSPIEAQALLIEAFDEVAADRQAVDDLKVWLLKSKQTQNWGTTKATTEACYALLLKGTDWLSTESNVSIVMGGQKIEPEKLPAGEKPEAGTGYFKTSWSGTDIKPTMGELTVVKKDQGVSWGALYWQYFEQLDKITPAKTPLSIKKQLFIQKNTSAGPVLEAMTDKSALKIGDRIKVRIELRVDRDMEYVHMKDMRASGFEPLNVISGYKWQDGLGYYESTRDAATNFFFAYLPKGTYVFEYPMFVTHTGDFSNGITSVQCMYAPEFACHSEGIRVKIGK
jgi:hypothetical protein